MTDKEIYQLLLGILEMIQSNEEAHVAMAGLMGSRCNLLETMLLKTLEAAALPDWKDREGDLLALKTLIEQSSHRDDCGKLLARIESQHEIAGHLRSKLQKALEGL